MDEGRWGQPLLLSVMHDVAPRLCSWHHVAMLKTAFRVAKAAIPLPVKEVLGSAYDAGAMALPHEMGLKARYWRSYKRLPRLAEPKLFSEKCQALKILNPPIGQFVDKVAVKQFVAERIGTEHVIPTLYAGSQLPPRSERNWPLPYVIKTNNGSGGNIFVRDRPNWDAIEAKVATFLSHDHARVGGEKFYSQVAPQVLVEPFIAEGNDLPLDYKFFTFDGKVRFIQVDTDREHAHKRAFFDAEWKRLPVKLGYPEDPTDIQAPRKLAKMLQLVSALGAGFSFVRVDFYEVGDRLLFGELTFTPESGLTKFEPRSVDADLGALWAWPPSVPA